MGDDPGSWSATAPPRLRQSPHLQQMDAALSYGAQSTKPPSWPSSSSSSSPQYLSRNVVQDVRREHFSFSPRMPVGDFYEERDTPEVGLGAAELPRVPPAPAPGPCCGR